MKSPDLNGDLLTEQTRLRRELAEERYAVAMLKKRLAEIEASSSWRVTAPFRWLVSRIRGELRGVPKATAAPFPAPSFLPDELVRRDRPSVGSSESCRLMDGRPLLVDLLPEKVMLTLLDEGLNSDIWQFGNHEQRYLALISGAEFARELAFDACVLRLDCGRWDRQLMANAKVPDFLLVDMDLRDLDSGWSHAIHEEGETGPFGRLLCYCRQQGIKVVFWLRMTSDEYPAVAQWLHLADAIYAIEEALLAVVEAAKVPGKVALLPPAVQPWLYNPIRTPLARDIGKELQHAVVCDALTEALESKSVAIVPGCLLVESYWDLSCAKISSSSEVSAQTLGVIRVEDKIALSRIMGAEFFAAVKYKPKWRIQLDMLRAAASGMLVGVAEGSRIDWPAGIGLEPAGTTPSALKAMMMDAMAAAKWRQRAMRNVLEQHTLHRRLQKIYSDLGLHAGEDRSVLVSCLLVSKRPERLAECIETFNRQKYPEKELVIVLHGDTPHRLQLPSFPRIIVLAASATLSLGDCLNMAFAAARGQFWAKLDDDDYYGPEYLSDMMLLARHIDCDVIAKPLVFTTFASDGALYWNPHRQELTYTLFAHGWPPGVVCGATLAGRREVLERIRFTNRRRYGVDSVFLEDCSQAGFRLMATDGFGYSCYRSGQSHDHTWEGEEAEVRAHGKQLGTLENKHYFVDA